MRTKSFPLKLTLFGELRRFRRHSDLRAEISLLTPSRSSKKDKIEALWCIMGHHYYMKIVEFCETVVISKKQRTIFTERVRTRPEHRGRGNKYVARPFHGETPCPEPRGDIPPRVFLPMSCSSFPTGRWRRGTPRKHNNNNTMACLMGPVPSIVARELPLIRSGVSPV